MLKTMGLNIAESDIKKLEVIIPQIPGMVTALVTFVQESDARQKRIEQLMEELVKNGRTNGCSSNPAAIAGAD